VAPLGQCPNDALGDREIIRVRQMKAPQKVLLGDSAVEKRLENESTDRVKDVG
jgi:hypothetical protein